jgi:RNA polymerase sigma-70 factor, ECF subfamily
MLMLETLNPIERAVFLLRNVFNYDYAEIARTVNKSEANCRQIASRAKNRLSLSASTLPTPNDQAERIVQQFLLAQRTGSLNDLLALLGYRLLAGLFGEQTRSAASSLVFVACFRRTWIFALLR